MTATAEYITRLSNLQEGELSLLRKLAGQRPDTTLHGFDLFTGLWWPIRNKSSKAPRRELSWLIAKLYATFSIPNLGQVSGVGHSLPHILGLIEPKNESNLKLFQYRFDALLGSSLSSLEPHLRWALGEVSRAIDGRVSQTVRGLDWVQLLNDLSIWDRYSVRRENVHLDWAKTYVSAQIKN